MAYTCVRWMSLNNKNQDNSMAALLLQLSKAKVMGFSPTVTTNCLLSLFCFLFFLFFYFLSYCFILLLSRQPVHLFFIFLFF